MTRSPAPPALRRSPVAMPAMRMSMSMSTRTPHHELVDRIVPCDTPRTASLPSGVDASEDPRRWTPERHGAAEAAAAAAGAAASSAVAPPHGGTAASRRPRRKYHGAHAFGDTDAVVTPPAVSTAMTFALPVSAASPVLAPASAFAWAPQGPLPLRAPWDPAPSTAAAGGAPPAAAAATPGTTAPVAAAATIAPHYETLPVIKSAAASSDPGGLTTLHSRTRFGSGSGSGSPSDSGSTRSRRRGSGRSRWCGCGCGNGLWPWRWRSGWRSVARWRSQMTRFHLVGLSAMLVIVAICIAIGSTLTIKLLEQDRARLQGIVDMRCRTIASSVTRSLLIHDLLVTSYNWLLSSQPSIDETMFLAFGSTLMNATPQSQRVGFYRVVPQAERAAVEAEAGHPFWGMSDPTTTDLTYHSPVVRPEAPVYAVLLFGRFRDPVPKGYDYLSSTYRLDLFQRANATGSIVYGGPYYSTEGMSSRILIPFQGYGTANTSATTGAVNPLVAFVSGVVSFDEIFGDALATLPDPLAFRAWDDATGLVMYDTTDQADAFPRSNTDTIMERPALAPGVRTAAGQVRYGERTITVQCQDSGALAANTVALTAMMCVLLCVVTCIIVIVVRRWVGAQRHVVKNKRRLLCVQNRLALTRANASAILDAIRDPMLTFDQDGYLLDTNPQATEATGYDASDIAAATATTEAVSGAGAGAAAASAERGRYGKGVHISTIFEEVSADQLDDDSWMVPPSSTPSTSPSDAVHHASVLASPHAPYRSATYHAAAAGMATNMGRARIDPLLDPAAEVETYASLPGAPTRSGAADGKSDLLKPALGLPSSSSLAPLHPLSHDGPDAVCASDGDSSDAASSLAAPSTLREVRVVPKPGSNRLPFIAEASFSRTHSAVLGPHIGAGQVVLLRDMTARRRVARELLDARQRAHLAARAKANLVGFLCHELRTPTHVVLGLNELTRSRLAEAYTAMAPLATPGAAHHSDLPPSRGGGGGGGGDSSSASVKASATALASPSSPAVGDAVTMTMAPDGTPTPTMLPGVDLDDLMENLDGVASAAGVMRTLLDDVLDLERLERGEIRLARQPFDLLETVQKVARLLHRARGSGRLGLPRAKHDAAGPRIAYHQSLTVLDGVAASPDSGGSSAAAPSPARTTPSPAASPHATTNGAAAAQATEAPASPFGASTIMPPPPFPLLPLAATAAPRVVVDGDAARLEQILLSLLGNAQRAEEADLVSLSVTALAYQPAAPPETPAATVVDVDSDSAAVAVAPATDALGSSDTRAHAPADSAQDHGQGAGHTHGRRYAMPMPRGISAAGPGAGAGDLSHGSRPPPAASGAEPSPSPYVARIKMRFVVRDNGAGLTPKQAALLTVPFSVSNATRGSSTAITGVAATGVAVCAALLQHMQAPLIVKSRRRDDVPDAVSDAAATAVPAAPPQPLLREPDWGPHEHGTVCWFDMWFDVVSFSPPDRVAHDQATVFEASAFPTPVREVDDPFQTAATTTAAATSFSSSSPPASASMAAPRFDPLVIMSGCGNGSGNGHNNRRLEASLPASPLSVTTPLPVTLHGAVAPPSTNAAPAPAVAVAVAPLAPASASAVASAPASAPLPPSAAKAGLPGWHPRYGRPIRLLVAEDNILVQRLAAKMLTMGGYEVVLAADGQKALDALNLHNPLGGAAEPTSASVEPARRPLDAVLMDLMMDHVNGYQATSLLRAQGHTRIPVIAFTANASETDRQRCLRQGFSAFVTKPFRLDEATRVIHQLLLALPDGPDGALLDGAGDGAGAGAGAGGAGVVTGVDDDADRLASAYPAALASAPVV
ncbi:hypothetical protein CXG81DRAFT_28213 [Caulochytrium protostelioides]|uniref:histidine kinase n=1 Tax=Caulochytrium protostelioides TaxID=1555241 RepID=A0A4P9WZP2_9FUNG|nr:hypothetical protein CXG81DRAFT_28213 [Caulochytrium protostelioides]|eukprot:RKO99004.1 hypothetical protein CXG81DRAFT_28213 [Caulochytrium protostelioides]